MKKKVLQRFKGFCKCENLTVLKRFCKCENLTVLQRFCKYKNLNKKVLVNVKTQLQKF